MRVLAALVPLLAAPAGAEELGAAILGIDARVERDPLGGAQGDVGFGLEGIVTRWRPACAALRLGLDPGSGGEGTSSVGTLALPVLARGGWCAGGRALFFVWGGAGATFTFVTSEVAGVSRTDMALESLFAIGIDVIVRQKWLAGLVGLSAEIESDRFAGVLRLGLGSFGP